MRSRRSIRSRSSSRSAGGRDGVGSEESSVVGSTGSGRRRPRWSSAALWVIRSSHDAERRVAAEVLEPVEGAQERVLADVLGLVGADDPGGDPDDDRPVAVDELLERAQLAARGAPDELGVVGSSVVEEG